MHNPLEHFVATRHGPMGYSRTCRGCGWSVFRRPGTGRGAGMREGNKQRGVAIQHVKMCSQVSKMIEAA